MTKRKLFSRRKILIIIGMIVFIAAVLFFLFYNGILWFVYPSLSGYDIKGIDVAHYQGEIDWEIIAKQNIRFAFVKATEGSSHIDAQFERNMLGANENEIPVGAYHFFSSESGGKTQAENFINAVSVFQTDLPPVLDFEIPPEKKEQKEKIIAEAKIFLTELENYFNIKPIIYTTYESFGVFLQDGFNEYPFWIRDLFGEPKIKDIEWIFWQYSDRGRLKGITGQQKFVDLNVFNGNEEEFEKYISGLK